MRMRAGLIGQQDSASAVGILIIQRKLVPIKGRKIIICDSHVAQPLFLGKNYSDNALRIAGDQFTGRSFRLCFYRYYWDSTINIPAFETISSFTAIFTGTPFTFYIIPYTFFFMISSNIYWKAEC